MSIYVDHKLLKHLLKKLKDVLISAPADGEVLTYEAASKKWKNKPGAAGPSMDKARIWNTANWTVPTSTSFPLTFNSENYDTDNLHDPAVNPSRITVNDAGYYLVLGCICYAPNATGIRRAYIYVNGAWVSMNSVLNAGATASAFVVVSDVRYLNAGDYLELYAWQNSGGDLTVYGVASTWFGASRIP